MANSVTAGSVVPLQWMAGRTVQGSPSSGMVRRARLIKSGTTVTLATFRLHLYGVVPASITNGDGGSWATNRSNYLGYFDLDMTQAPAVVFNDSAEVIGVAAVGSEINFAIPANGILYGLLEAMAAYVPLSAEVFTVELEVLQN